MTTPLHAITQSFATIGQWLKRQHLRSQHREVLSRYEKQQYSLYSDLSIEAALKDKLLDPQYLHGPELEKKIPSLSPFVWDCWNNSSALRHEVYKQFYGVTSEQLRVDFRSTYNTLMPFEQLMHRAVEQNNVQLLAWMHALPNPWRPIEWKPLELIGGSVDVGNWVLDTFTGIQVEPLEGEYLSKQLLLRRDNTKTIPTNYRNINTAAFSNPEWKDFNGAPEKYSKYAQRVLDMLLPTEQWSWARRWSSIGKEMPLAISPNASNDYEREVVAHQGCIMAALLHEAPLAIQQLLCAFKGAKHPSEPEEGAPDAQYIRHHFFDLPPPSNPPSPVLVAIFLCVDGVDPDAEVDFVMEQMLRSTGDNPIESYSLNEIELSA